MTVIIDGREYQAESAVKLIELIKLIRWDPQAFPTPESYIKTMAKTYKRIMHRKMPLPRGSAEERARAMFKELAKIHVWEYKEE